MTPLYTPEDITVPETDWKQEAAEAMQMLEGESCVPITQTPNLHGYAVIELRTLDELRRYFREGAYIHMSQIRGIWLYLPVEQA
jgi:hypothetical protein